MLYLLKMKTFENYRGEVIFLHPDTLEHIQDMHSEIDLLMISKTLKDPDEVRWSKQKEDSQLYYLLRTQTRYTCIVVKICEDGHFISTALTTNKPKIGNIYYQRGD
ncbi:MAG: hypothetical protein JNM93_10895 [Bacteriovoracaceae bacterium]|nr:hypothetical protein [Bacteriovoracaceae bacterium]